MPGRKSATVAVDVDRWVAVTQEPQRAPFGGPAAVEEQVELGVERDGRAELVDLVPLLGEPEDLAHRDPGSGDVARRRAGVLGHAVVVARCPTG